MLRTLLLLPSLAVLIVAQGQSDAAVYDAEVQSHFTADAPGGAVLVAQGGKVLYERALGLANMSTKTALTTANQFRIGSVTKQFAAVAIVQLEEAGKLKVTDEIQLHVDFPKKEKPITIQHLLTHTSGIPNFTNGPSYSPDAYAKDIALPDLIALFADLPLEFEPGTKWNYSNSGYILLTAIIEKVSGQGWSDYAQKHLFVPAGMSNTTASLTQGSASEAIGYAEDSTGWKLANPVSMTWPLGAGNIRSTVGDLWKWNTSVFTGKLVPLERLSQAHRPVVLADGSKEQYGFGWGFQNVQSSPTIEHNGGIDGFVSASLYLPKEDIYVIVLVNRESDDANNLAPKLAAIALGKPYGGPEVALTAAEAVSYTGVYVNAEGVERYLTADGNTLRSMRQGSSPKPLRHLGNDSFLYEGDVITLTFQRTAGKVTGARFLARDRDEQLTRSDKPLPKPREEIKLNNADLQAYVGEYELMPGFTLTFRADGDRFFVVATRQQELEVFGEAPHKFFLKEVDASMEFHPEADGSVKRLTFIQGQKMEGKRVKQDLPKAHLGTASGGHLNAGEQAVGACCSIFHTHPNSLHMERQEFLHRGLLGTALAFIGGALSGTAKAMESLATGGQPASPAGGRGVEGVLSPTNTHMVGNGFKVMNFFPNGKGFEERMSPFFLLDFNAEVNFPPSDISQGVGVHPHRGIETITFAYKGSVEHHDSKGNHGIIHPGDIQWMTAGGGVLHKEYHEQTFNRTGGAFEMLQLWINLPRKHKMVPAKYQSIAHSKKPKVVLPKGAGTVHVVAGEYEGVKGIASAYSPIHMYDMHLNAGADVNFQLPANYNSGILVVDGAITVNGTAAPENHYIQLKNEGGAIRIQVTRTCILMVLSGEPLNEPYVSYGPFVMNTEEEIREAIEDYKAGKFGFLED